MDCRPFHQDSSGNTGRWIHTSFQRYHLGLQVSLTPWKFLRVCSSHGDTVSWQARVNPRTSHMDHFNNVHTHHRPRMKSLGTKSKQHNKKRKKKPCLEFLPLHTSTNTSCRYNYPVHTFITSSLQLFFLVSKASLLARRKGIFVFKQACEQRPDEQTYIYS